VNIQIGIDMYDRYIKQSAFIAVHQIQVCSDSRLSENGPLFHVKETVKRQQLRSWSRGGSDETPVPAISIDTHSGGRIKHLNISIVGHEPLGTDR